MDPQEPAGDDQPKPAAASAAESADPPQDLDDEPDSTAGSSSWEPL